MRSTKRNDDARVHEPLLSHWGDDSAVSLPFFFGYIIPLDCAESAPIKTSNRINESTIRRRYSTESASGFLHALYCMPLICKEVISLDSPNIFFSVVTSNSIDAIRKGNTGKCSSRLLQGANQIPLSCLEIIALCWSQAWVVPTTITSYRVNSSVWPDASCKFVSFHVHFRELWPSTCQ